MRIVRRWILFTICLYWDKALAIEWSTSLLHESFNFTHNEKLLVDGNVIYIGGKNFLKRIEYFGDKSVSEKQLDVSQNGDSLKTCKKFSQSPETDCGNNIRILQNYNSNKLIVCDTNSLNPICYFVDKKTISSVETANFKLDLSNAPAESIVLTGQNDTFALYTASTSSKSSWSIKRMGETPLTSKKSWFKEPRMVKIHKRASKPGVYVFMNDKIDALDQCNPGYNPYVARVCENDEGKPQAYTSSSEIGEWATHAKAHIKCYSSKGEIVLKYSDMNKIQTVNDIVYGLFNLPESWGLNSSAICAYHYNSIGNVLDGKTYNGKTKYRKVPYSFGDSLVTYSHMSQHSFYPGQCPTTGNSTMDLLAAFYSFTDTYPVVHEEISPVTNSPIYTYSGTTSFKHMLVTEVKQYSIAFLFSDDGLMQKLRIKAYGRFENDILQEVNIFGAENTGNNRKILSVSFSFNKTKIVVVTSSRVLLVSTSSCSSWTTCSSCTSDPHCYWITNDGVDYKCSEEKGIEYFETCDAPPPSPTNVVALYNENDLLLEVNWDKWGESCSGRCTSVVSVTDSNNSNITKKFATSGNNVTITGLRLAPGSSYKVCVINLVNGTESKYTFYGVPREMSPVIIDYDSEKKLVSWSSETASYYIVRFYDNDVISFVGNVSATTTKLKHDLPFALGPGNYNISITAVSRENFHSPESFTSVLVLKSGQPTAESIRTVACAGPSNHSSLIIVFAFLFGIAVLIIIYNLYAIPPKETALISAKGNLTYERRFMLLWIRQSNKLNQVNTSEVQQTVVPSSPHNAEKLPETKVV